MCCFRQTFEYWSGGLNSACGLPPKLWPVGCNSLVQSRQAAGLSVAIVQQRLCDREFCMMLHAGSSWPPLNGGGPAFGLPPVMFKVACNIFAQSRQPTLHTGRRPRCEIPTMQCHELVPRPIALVCGHYLTWLQCSFKSFIHSCIMHEAQH